MQVRYAIAVAVLVLAALSLGAEAPPATSGPAFGATTRRVPRTLVTTSKTIWGFAQDGREIAWVTTQDRVPCRTLHFRALRTGRTASLRLRRPFDDYCGGFDLALAGRTVLWKETVGAGNNERDLRVMTATAGQRRPDRVERLYMWWDLDSGLPGPDPALAGAGSLLVYYAEQDGPGHGDLGEHAIRRIVRGAKRTLFAFDRPLGLAVNRGRVAVVRQVLRGDGCGCNNAPDWAPDGSRIAFLDGNFFNDDETAPADVAIMNADGSGRTVLTHDGVGRSALDWSPDGSKIVSSYVKAGLGAGWTIALVNADGTGAHDLGAGQEPAWSPEGTEIAFTRSDLSGSDRRIFVMDSAGASVRQLTSGQGPAWSPDGTRIAYSDGGALAVMNADGSDQHHLTTIAQLAHNPDWSPDGQRIVFGAGGYFYDGGIWVVNADGTGLRQLSAAGDDRPKWSPDGQRILFASNRNDIVPNHQFSLELYTMSSDGTDVRALTFTKRAEWASPGQIRSSSGRRLASFEAVGAPANAWSIFPESGSVALGGNLAAVLSLVAATGRAQITVFDARTGVRKSVVPVPTLSRAGGWPTNPLLALAGISGRWVVFRTGKTIRALDARRLTTSVLAVVSSQPVGLSVSGRRVAWAENVAGHGRIRAIMLRR